VQFCRERGIAHEICGKVIIATRAEELPLLDALRERGIKNELVVEPLGPEQVREVEPHVRAVAGLRVPTTGIVDYKAVCQVLAADLQSRGAELRLNSKVRSVQEQERLTVLETNDGPVEAKLMINCAGLHSDRVARMSGADPKAR